MRIDLHCHSLCSDGVDAPEAVARAALARKVELFALTDHDTCAGCDVIASALGAAALRGVEISCDDGAGTVHVLAYGGGATWAELERALDDRIEARRTRLRVIAAQLKVHRGVKLDIEPILAAAGTRAVGRPDLARAMIAQKIVGSMKEAFSRYLYDGGPGDAPGHRLPIAEALAMGRAVGAKMALAHPHQLGDRAAPLVKRHKADGLDGIEAYYGPYTPQDRAHWAKIADELGVIATAGSDRHEPGDAELGVDVPDDRAKRLTAWVRGEASRAPASR
ncbi:MAG TPA: PHP domain-containing protein [Kofleriaceae bacterium]|nr:PHP domain-containing protein [Kofleriaceae bacterium]